MGGTTLEKASDWIGLANMGLKVFSGISKIMGSSRLREVGVVKGLRKKVKGFSVR